MFVQIVINVSSSNVDQEYTYILPEELEKNAKVGARVVVSFGPSNRLVMGYIIKICSNTNYNVELLKEIDEILDYEPLISEEQIELAKKIKDDTICPLVRILNMMIPKALVLKTYKYLTLVNYSNIDESLVGIFSNSDTVKYTKSLWNLDAKIAREVKKGNIIVSYEAKPKANIKEISKYSINPTFYTKNMDNIINIRQKNFLKAIVDEVAMTSIELIDKYEVNEGIIQNLYKKGYLKKIKVPETRIIVRDVPIQRKIRITKNQNITKVLEDLREFEKPILYIPEDEVEQLEAIYQIINMNNKEHKNVVIITPEILSSYRISHLIRVRTGLSVLTINSNLSDGELFDDFYEIINDKYQVIVSTSSGALLPYKNVGTFILLNSESDNYYNDQSPRYNLKKVMIDYSNLINAKIIMMTFVPSIIDYSYGLKNYYKIIENSKLKDIKCEVIDLKTELKIGNNTPISRSLYNAILDDFNNRKFSMLIVNNKSYSSYVMCRNCGNTLTCSRCKTSLQYNKKINMLVCPSCSNRIPYSDECNVCHSSNWKMGGVGVEQVEEIIRGYFPNLKIKTLCSSTYEEYYETMFLLENNDINIVITTSVLANNIDSENLGTIGIICLDSISRGTTTDANERAYSMLVQSRNRIYHLDSSRLIIQTYNPDDQFLKDFLTSNYHGYLKNELSIRKILKTEPFYYINRIIVKGKYELVFKEANNIKSILLEMTGKKVFIIGPTYNYSYQGVQIIIKHRLNDISKYYKKIYENYQTTTMTIIFDCYPKHI